MFKPFTNYSRYGLRAMPRSDMTQQEKEKAQAIILALMSQLVDRPDWEDLKVQFNELFRIISTTSTATKEPTQLNLFDAARCENLIMKECADD